MEFNNWLTNIQDWWFPRLCPGCRDWTGPGRELCPACEQGLPVLESACPRCASPYAHANTRGLCGACQKKSPAFAATIAVYHYAPPVDHFIRALKFQRELSLARLLGKRLAARVAGLPRPDRILPVPLHSARLRSRGFNQALEIARPLARRLGIPLDTRSLHRIRATAAQSDLSPEERRRNVRGAFAVRDGARLDGLRVALVDDVMTTGSTVQAAAKALLAAGAEEVSVWVVARA
jgi:ComF family protein